MKGRYMFGNPGVDQGTILKCIINTECGNVDWIHLAQDRVQWQDIAIRWSVLRGVNYEYSINGNWRI
jgi:hypothetical protein